MELNNLRLSTKFTLAVGFILLIFCIVFSSLLYLHLKNRVIEDANGNIVAPPALLFSNRILILS